MLNSEENLIKDDLLQKNNENFTEREWEIHHMEGGTNILITSNFLENTSTRTELTLPWKVSSNIGVCKLPNNDILFWDTIGFIRKNNGNINLLPIDRGNSGSCLVVYNDYVYAFGGWKQPYRKDTAYKLGIQKSRLILIAKMPKPSRFCSAVVFRSKILISGKDISELYLYDPLIDSYSKTSLSLQKSNKVLFRGVLNGGVYLCQSLERVSQVFLSFDFYNWNITFTSRVVHGPLISYVAYNENLVYFIDAIQHFYSFDLKLNSLNKL